MSSISGMGRSFFLDWRSRGKRRRERKEGKREKGGRKKGKIMIKVCGGKKGNVFEELNDGGVVADVFEDGLNVSNNAVGWREFDEVVEEKRVSMLFLVERKEGAADIIL